ncbi:MAG: AraC family ligand binding domain-containing protein, partial [Pseudomonadota bacterium]
MDFVEWHCEQRSMSRHEIDDFYEKPLQDITVFRFETAGLEMPEHHGSFSLKSIRKGKEHYFFHGRSVSLRPGQVLLVNAEERYGSEITEDTSSLAVFYRESELGSALDALTLSPDMLLDAVRHNESREVAQIVLANDEAVMDRLA